MTNRLSPTERFWVKVDKTSTCWLWTASRHRDGYGKFWDGQRLVYAHRWAYENLVAPIPGGLTIDHLCRTRHCVNPQHMEVVTSGENAMRGEGPAARARRVQACPQGHPYDEVNTYYYKNGRQCRQCRYDRNNKKVECETCGITMWATNLYEHRRTAKHLGLP